MATKNQRQGYTHFTDPLCILGNILAIIPPCSSKTGYNANKIQIVYKCYAVFVLLMMVIGTGLTMFCRFKEVYPILPSSTLIVTDLGVTLSTAITNILAVLMPSLWHLQDFQMFFKILRKTDNCLPKDQVERVKTCKSFYAELAIGHLILLVLFIYDAYVWIIGLGFARYRYYTIKGIQNYHLYITIMIMYNFALLIKHQFEALNDDLSQLVNLREVSNNGITKIQVTLKNNETHHAVRKLSIMYETQIKQIKLFNKIFGWQILFMTLCTLMGLLNSLNNLTVFQLTGYKATSGDTLGPELEILSFLWALWQLLLGATVVVSCSKAERTAENTSDVCFNLLLKLPINSDSLQEKALRDELVLLNLLVTNCRPSFSAAGFFSVNYSLLLAIFGSVTSYVIVLIELN